MTNLKGGSGWFLLVAVVLSSSFVHAGDDENETAKTYLVKKAASVAIGAGEIKLYKQLDGPVHRRVEDRHIVLLKQDLRAARKEVYGALNSKTDALTKARANYESATARINPLEQTWQILNSELKIETNAAERQFAQRTLDRVEEKLREAKSMKATAEKDVMSATAALEKLESDPAYRAYKAVTEWYKGAPSKAEMALLPKQIQTNIVRREELNFQLKLIRGATGSAYVLALYDILGAIPTYMITGELQTPSVAILSNVLPYAYDSVTGKKEAVSGAVSSDDVRSSNNGVHSLR